MRQRKKEYYIEHALCQYAWHVTWSICDQKEHRNTMATGRLKIRKVKPVIKMRGTEIKTNIIIIILHKTSQLFIEF